MMSAPLEVFPKVMLFLRDKNTFNGEEEERWVKIAVLAYLFSFSSPAGWLAG
jgi:hypothetical protein